MPRTSEERKAAPMQYTKDSDGYWWCENGSSRIPCASGFTDPRGFRLPDSSAVEYEDFALNSFMVVVGDGVVLATIQFGDAIETNAVAGVEYNTTPKGSSVTAILE